MNCLIDNYAATKQEILKMIRDNLLKLYINNGESEIFSRATNVHVSGEEVEKEKLIHPCRDSGRLPPTNLLYRRSTSPSSANGLFQFPAPTSGTVFHHTCHLHRRSLHSDSDFRRFSFTCYIQTLSFDLLPPSMCT